MTMQDRLKYRVWAKPHEPTNTEGYYVDDADYMVMTPDGKVQIEYYCDNGYDGYIESFEQDEIIIEQCIGLKDMNSKLIYEGDIVDIWVVINIQGEIDRRRGKVYWSEEDACFSIYVALDEEYPLYGQDIYIIGNIHENADLLENKDE